MIINHQISKLVFELTFPSEDKVVSGQQKIERVVQDHLTDALERILDKYDQQEVTTKIDRLEIDLNFIDLSLPESEMVQKIRQEIEFQLDKLFQNSEKESYTKHIDGKNITVERQIQEDAQTNIELVLFIIKNGHLPWWVTMNSEFVKLEQLITNLIEVDESRFFKSLSNELKFINFRKRLTQLLSLKQMEWLIVSLNKDLEFHADSFERIRLLQPEKRQEVYDRLIIAGLVYEQTDKENYIRIFYETAKMFDFSLNDFIKAGKNKMNQIDLLHTLSEEKSSSKNNLTIKTTAKTTEEKEKKEAQHDLSTNTAKKTTKEEEEKKLHKNSPTSDAFSEEKEKKGEKEVSQENDLTTKEKEERGASSKHDITSKTITETNEKESSSSENDIITQTFEKNAKEIPYQHLMNLNQIHEDIVEGIVIQRAGLVLIIPFLPSFLGELGLLKDKKYTSEESRHHAVYLLYYLATGSEDMPDEHHLVFEKICCGVDITECLLPFKGISTKEKEEVDSLLLSMLESWKALKNSSQTAVRNGFLNREGYLKKQGDGTWHVHIERQTIDILIDRLPWTISIMRIPSVNEMIYVEW